MVCTTALSSPKPTACDLQRLPGLEGLISRARCRLGPRQVQHRGRSARCCRKRGGRQVGDQLKKHFADFGISRPLNGLRALLGTAPILGGLRTHGARLPAPPRAPKKRCPQPSFPSSRCVWRTILQMSGGPSSRCPYIIPTPPRSHKALPAFRRRRNRRSLLGSNEMS